MGFKGWKSIVEEIPLKIRSGFWNWFRSLCVPPELERLFTTFLMPVDQLSCPASPAMIKSSVTTHQIESSLP